jgi:hypothetical protein
MWRSGLLRTERTAHRGCLLVSSALRGALSRRQAGRLTDHMDPHVEQKLWGSGAAHDELGW